jgi:hypothetical protein
MSPALIAVWKISGGRTAIFMLGGTGSRYVVRIPMGFSIPGN